MVRRSILRCRWSWRFTFLRQRCPARHKKQEFYCIIIYKQFVLFHLFLGHIYVLKSCIWQNIVFNWMIHRYTERASITPNWDINRMYNTDERVCQHRLFSNKPIPNFYICFVNRVRRIRSQQGMRFCLKWNALCTSKSITLDAVWCWNLNLMIGLGETISREWRWPIAFASENGF